MQSEVPIWFSASQAIVCWFAGLALLSFWGGGVPEYLRATGARVRRDPGLFWLAAAVLVWALLGTGIWWRGAAHFDIALAVASTINNGFFVLAVAHFEHGPRWTKGLRAPRRRSAFLLFVAVGALAQAAWASATTGWMRQLPDVLLSFATLALLGWALAVSFARRGFRLLAILAVVAILSQVAAQWRDPAYHWVLMLASKTMTLTIFLALAMSWAHERARLSGLDLFFGGRLVGDRVEVLVAGEPRLMTPEVHRRLVVFALERVQHPADGGGFVNIKEKGIAHTHIARIVEQLALSDRVALFDNDGRSGYRLKVPPRHLGFDLQALRHRPELADLVEALARTLDVHRRVS
jgi:hypothetical protein